MRIWMKWMLAVVFTATLVTAACMAANAGVASMYYDGRETITLSDGTKLTLFLTLDSTPEKPCYYYLPANLHIALKPDGTPQFLFLKFTTEQRETEGGIQGALLHFLMEFGLTPRQETELRNRLQQIHENAELAGVAPVEPDGETSTFQITSATLTDQGLTKSLVTSGKAPLVPGQRVAAAARLTGNGAQLLAATLDKTRSITDLTVSFNLSYTTLLPAVEGTIIFDWDKFQSQSESLTKDYEHKYKTHTHWWGSTHTTNHQYTYTEMRNAYDFLRENNVITMDLNVRKDDERTAKVVDYFFQVFLDSFNTSDDMDAQEALGVQNSSSSDSDKDPKGPALAGDSTKWRYYSSNTTNMQKRREYHIKYGLPYTETFTLTGNVMEWYDTARDNPACVSSINLNDPFFSHRDIKFILDVEAKEMFDDAVNYVTVNVRKKRSSGRDFEDHVTIDPKYLKENGITASVTYARGEDTNPDAYEYQAQWSLRGGNVYPTNPPWIKGSWEGVGLAPPVRPMTIEFEGDLEDMKAQGFTRCTCQIHYYKFGKEAETNISVSPAQNEPLASAKIFLDRDQKAYAYRMIYNHKTAGKLVGPWVTNASDQYIYASLPEDILTADTYKERAKSLITGKIEEILQKLSD